MCTNMEVKNVTQRRKKNISWVTLAYILRSFGFLKTILYHMKKHLAHIGNKKRNETDYCVEDIQCESYYGMYCVP